MKKLIKRFWGVGLIVIILSSLIVLPATSVSAGAYAFATDTTQPTAINRLLNYAGATPIGPTDEAQTADGTTLYMTSNNNTGYGPNYGTLYTSTNGGTSWAPCTATLYTAATPMDMVAVAPDSAAIVAVVAKTTNVVYLSTTGGSVFSALPATGLATINDISISALSGPYRYIAVAGNTGAANGGKVLSWTYGAAAPAWSDITLGGGATLWTGLAVAASLPDDVNAVAFSPSFPSDQAIMAVATIAGTATVSGNVSINVGSYNIRKWNTLVDTSFPRFMKTTVAGVNTLTCARARIALDPAFYLGDAATQIGFIGAEITLTGVEVGGVFRFDYSVAGGVNTATQIMTGTAISSVAWDGTNLVAGAYVPGQPAPGTVTTIYRSSNPLASAVGVTFLPSATPKTPSTGFEAVLTFAAGNVLCFTQGTNGGVAKSTDLGKSFNGIALLNTNLATIWDTAVSPDGKTIYMTVGDGVDLNVWRFMNTVWQRVLIIPAGTAQPWLVRMAASDPTAVVLGWRLNPNMYIATDAGEYKWTARSCSTSIADFAVESNAIVYVVGGTAGVGTNIVKSVNGAFTWSAAVNTNINLYGGGNCYSITLIAAGKLLVGGTAGGVTYSADSGTTWTTLPSLVAGGNILATATGLATGDTIYATSSAAGAICKWIIGTNAPPNNWTQGVATLTGATGLAFTNGILYVLDDSVAGGVWGTLYRFLTPNVTIGVFSDNKTDGGGSYGNIGQGAGTSVNALQVSNGSVSLWTHNVAAIDTLDSFTEYLATAADAPKLTFPTNGYMVQVNSLNGGANGFVFQWTSPAAISTTINYNYELQVYLDAAGLIPVAGSATAPILAAATPAPGVSTASGLGIGAPVVAFAPVPGTTYYWRVRTAANTPIRSQWSTMWTFTIQPLAASVPVIGSPANGATITNQSPAFSWSPVAMTTQYDFQLSTTPTFGTTILTDQPASAGTLVPVTIKLDQGKQYFWRVRALQPVQGDWSAVGNFMVALPATTAAAPVTITIVPAPTIVMPAQPAPTTYTLAQPATNEIAPSYIWAIIIIGGILVIAVIVLIVRTRRSV